MPHPRSRSAAIKQLIYRSQPFGFDQSMLDGILMAARRNNRANGITGALICRQDMYIQLVEGPDDAIDALYQRILADDRHTDVKLEMSLAIEERMFPRWAMLDDTNPSMTFSKEEVEDGAIDRASPEALRALFRRIADRANAASTAT
ncbi:Sensors of blue-light using FAD [Erythrobacter sp. HL-111]|nr:Sensors of blue-light using FAD [Erythrobacter sp. HL-111]